MLQPKKTFLLAVIFTLALIMEASAGLYGFSKFPQEKTAEDKLLDSVPPPRQIMNYADLMRQNLIMLIDYARAQKPNFQVIVHESPELLSKGSWEYNLDGYNEVRAKGKLAQDPTFLNNELFKNINLDPPAGSLAQKYRDKINGLALNNLFCSPQNEEKFAQTSHFKIISFDYCRSTDDFNQAISQAVANQAIIYGFTNLENAFTDIKNQPIINESAENITQVLPAQNILVVDDDSTYESKEALINDLRDTGFDIIVIPSQFHREVAYSLDEIYSLKFKKNGAQRIVLAELNVSEANPDEYYWKKYWQAGNPSWLVEPSTTTKDSLIAAYWKPEWQQIISRHMKDIVKSDFDGVFFSGSENYQYFAKQTPLE